MGTEDVSVLGGGYEVHGFQVDPEAISRAFKILSVWSSSDP